MVSCVAKTRTGFKRLANAKRPIAVGDELTFDYTPQYWKDRPDEPLLGAPDAGLALERVVETPDAFQALLRLVGRANLRSCCLVSHAWLDEVRALLESGEGEQHRSALQRRTAVALCPPLTASISVSAAAAAALSGVCVW